MDPAHLEVSRILDQLHREHAGDAWHGTPLRQLLADVDDRHASARPIPSAHTIWQIVLHITAWKNEVRRRLGGAPAGLPAEGDWPAPPSPSPHAWRESLHALEQAHEALIAAARDLADEQLDRATNDPRDAATGAGVSVYVLLHGIVQHDVYHAGQIALLKKAAESPSSQPARR